MTERLADLFKQITAGIYVVGVAHEERRNAFTAAWIMQVSFTPLLLALSINPDHASYPLLIAGRVFSVNVLRRGQIELARQFGTKSARDLDKLAGIVAPRTDRRADPSGFARLLRLPAYAEPPDGGS